MKGTELQHEPVNVETTKDSLEMEWVKNVSNPLGP